MSDFWGSEQDRENDRKAMLVMQRHLCIPLEQSESELAGWDFRSVQPGVLCEHKARDIDKVHAARLGSIYFEKDKAANLIATAFKRGDVPMFVVTLSCGTVLYMNANDVTTYPSEVANRHAKRPHGKDDDECWKVNIEHFKQAGEVW